jgi:DNA-binding transcriptional regulator GbsR (MarR family)
MQKYVDEFKVSHQEIVDYWEATKMSADSVSIGLRHMNGAGVVVTKADFSGAI